MPRLWARTVTFDSVCVGDQLPILVKSETQDSIDRLAALTSPARPAGDTGSDRGGEPADQVASPEAADSGASLVAYVFELLEKAFPIGALQARGSRLEVQAIGPVRPGDTVTLSGQVVAKSGKEGEGLIECEIIAENQEGQAVARAIAAIPLR